MATKPKAVRRTERQEASQAERFIEAARQAGVDETGAAFETAMAKVVRPRLARASPSESPDPAFGSLRRPKSR